ncbi:hypothetical protein CDL62_00695 [Alkalitalea saponilacus]|uniref:Tetratricopeptide repeat-containing protein n=2 Tax=Alkalitalea saponilacus TaxID=889453 RepID=A0A1T5HKI3_9BACT|nr:hypothetical protein CDL62_00695 [Alkalitalea saponilacus]SKC21139.1 hypothetical protein SAMN03080601_02373 [Alkalitalea saponilacus]
MIITSSNMKILILSFLLLGVVSQPGISQVGGFEYKLRGLDFLQAGKVDSAMVYLNQATLLGLNDGEVLGGLALAYILQGDAQRALEKAVDARRDRTNPSQDAYLAGFLAHEQLGNVRQRNRWMEQGLDLFPGDYLLLFHAGRVLIPFDKEEGERLLLKSIHAEPGFAPAHLLLGEQMHRRGENLKAALPLLYYLMLHHDTPESAELVRVLERLYDSWAASSASISRHSNVSRGFSVPFVPELPDKRLVDDESRANWYVNQTNALLQSLQLADVTSEDALWVFYSDFFAQVARLNFSMPLAMHTAYSRYPSEVMVWMSENARQYDMLANWLLIQ